MPLEEAVQDIVNRIPDLIQHLETEEATKNALIMPFITALGYNVFNPTEVVPEFTADVGNKSGEKVDYAIVHNGQPIILFECKAAGVALNEQHRSQLVRYFTVTPVRIGVLTNGIVYSFYADLDRPNMMDSKPFLEFDLTKPDDAILAELQKFAKGTFDVETTLAAASELKYTREIKQILSLQLRSPEEDFVGFLTGRIYSGRRTQQVIERFTQITKDAFNQFINDRVQDRLRSAMSLGELPTDEQTPNETEPVIEVEPDTGVNTTVEELESFYIVKALLREVVPPDRVAIRDFKNQCSILLDDNIRKRICNLYFNSQQKSVGFLDAERNEERVTIDSIDDLYALADQIRAVVLSLDSAN